MDKLLSRGGAARETAATKPQATDSKSKKAPTVATPAVAAAPADNESAKRSSRSKRSQSVPATASPPAKVVAAAVAPGHEDELGSGTPEDPFHLPLRTKPNRSGCVHCPAASCCCVMIAEELERAYNNLPIKRVAEASASKRALCAKSVLPQFVSRMARIANITSADTFYDLGCGNGSVLFQVAFMTGANCVGIELSPHNAEVARQAWAELKPVLEKKAHRKMPRVDIITGDIGEVTSRADFATAACVIWTANKLMPKSLTHYMSERFRSLPVGSRVLCMDDLYPHGRSVARIRDPDAFAKFEMADYLWQEMSVEWCTHDGPLYLHRKRT